MCQFKCHIKFWILWPFLQTLCFLLSDSSLWDSHCVPWFSWSFPRGCLDSVLCSVFLFFFLFYKLNNHNCPIFKLLIISYVYLNLFNSLVKFSTTVFFNHRISTWFPFMIFISWWCSHFMQKLVYWFPLVISWYFPLALWECLRQLIWSFCLLSPMSKPSSRKVFIKCVPFLLRVLPLFSNICCCCCYCWKLNIFIL